MTTQDSARAAVLLWMKAHREMVKMAGSSTWNDAFFQTVDEAIEVVEQAFVAKTQAEQLAKVQASKGDKSVLVPAPGPMKLETHGGATLQPVDPAPKATTSTTSAARPKLTRPQVELLEMLAKEAPRYVADTYKPVVRLVELGLVATDARHRRYYVITQAGKDWLAGRSVR